MVSNIQNVINQSDNSIELIQKEKTNAINDLEIQIAKATKNGGQINSNIYSSHVGN